MRLTGKQRDEIKKEKKKMKKKSKKNKKKSQARAALLAGFDEEFGAPGKALGASADFSSTSAPDGGATRDSEASAAAVAAETSTSSQVSKRKATAPPPASESKLGRQQKALKRQRLEEKQTPVAKLGLPDQGVLLSALNVGGHRSRGGAHASGTSGGAGDQVLDFVHGALADNLRPGSSADAAIDSKLVNKVIVLDNVAASDNEIASTGNRRKLQRFATGDEKRGYPSHFQSVPYFAFRLLD